MNWLLAHLASALLAWGIARLFLRFAPDEKVRED